jgi:hypothetical protein
MVLYLNHRIEICLGRGLRLDEVEKASSGSQLPRAGGSPPIEPMQKAAAKGQIDFCENGFV